jgi:hypothetical protein
MITELKRLAQRTPLQDVETLYIGEDEACRRSPGLIGQVK